MSPSRQDATLTILRNLKPAAGMQGTGLSLARELHPPALRLPQFVRPETPGSLKPVRCALLHSRRLFFPRCTCDNDIAHTRMACAPMTKPVAILVRRRRCFRPVSAQVLPLQRQGRWETPGTVDGKDIHTHVASRADRNRNDAERCCEPLVPALAPIDPVFFVG